MGALINSIGKIGVLMPEVADPLDFELLRGIHNDAASLGYDVIVYCSIFHSQVEQQRNTYTNGQDNIFSLVTQHRLDGILFAAERFYNQALNAKIQEMLLQSGVPCLVLGEERPPLPAFFARQYEGTYRMTKHLIEVHGCRLTRCWHSPMQSAGSFRTAPIPCGLMNLCWRYCMRKMSSVQTHSSTRLTTQ